MYTSATALKALKQYFSTPAWEGAPAKPLEFNEIKLLGSAGWTELGSEAAQRLGWPPDSTNEPLTTSTK